MSADGGASNIVDLEADIDVVANKVLLLLGLVLVVNGLMVLHLVIYGREADVSVLAPAHSAKNNLVVLLEEHVLHHELLVNLASLAEVHELSLIVASLVPVVDVVRILNERARALDKHKLQNGVLVYYSINEIFVVYSLYLT